MKIDLKLCKSTKMKSKKNISKIPSIPRNISSLNIYLALVHSSSLKRSIIYLSIHMMWEEN